MMKFTCTKDLFRIIHGRKQLLIHIRQKTWKYPGVLLSIMVDEADLKNITKQWINDIRLFNNKHIIQRYNTPESNIPE